MKDWRRFLLPTGLVLFTTTVFMVDLLTPEGVEVCVLYLPVILAPVWLNNPRWTLIACGACSGLVVIGIFFSPPGNNPHSWDLINRSMGLMALWLMTFAALIITRRSIQVAEALTTLKSAIAKQEQAERALEQSEERLRLAVAGAGMGAFDGDLRTGKVVWSANHYRMFGLEPVAGGEVTLAFWLSCIHPDDLEGVLKTRNQALRDRSLYAKEYRIRRCDNQASAWLAVFGRFHFDEAGQAVRFLGVSFDITRQKELEREVLEIAVREQRRIGQELHDSVGQELTGLGLMASALAQGGHDPAAGKNIVTRLITGFDRMHQQVRALSRGLVPVQVERQGLSAVLEELVANVNGQTTIRVTFECTPEISVPDHFTATQLYRIAQEAVSNAMRHSQARHVSVRLFLEHDGLCLQIQDDGVGMPDQSKNGQGMGLRIMQYRADQIGGVLHFDRMADGGMLVKCTLNRRTKDDGASMASFDKTGENPARG